MKITVIVCTYNRCQSLAKTLHSIIAQALPPSIKWELLVVDNNSKDATRSVVEELCQKYPDLIRYIFEPRQGLSYARNAGIQQAEGDVLAFTDDDVIAEPNWLQNLTAPLLCGDCAGVGGRIRPEQTFVAPRWLSLDESYALAPLAIFDAGHFAHDLVEPPFGANMAFQRTMFAKYGDFRTDLGRCAETLSSNEDTEFGRRLFAAGQRLRYEPSAVVYHPVTENRLQKKYFLTWWFNKGKTDVREFGIPTDTNWLIAGIPLVLFRRMATGILRWLFAANSSKRFSRKIRVWRTVGKIIESYRQSFRFPSYGDRDHQRAE